MKYCMHDEKQPLKPNRCSFIMKENILKKETVLYYQLLQLIFIVQLCISDLWKISKIILRYIDKKLKTLKLPYSTNKKFRHLF